MSGTVPSPEDIAHSGILFSPVEPGMVLNVERTLSKNGYLGDFEETVLITEDGTALLTEAITRPW